MSRTETKTSWLKPLDTAPWGTVKVTEDIWAGEPTVMRAPASVTVDQLLVWGLDWPGEEGRGLRVKAKLPPFEVYRTVVGLT